jgi:hypothetical protein
VKGEDLHPAAISLSPKGGGLFPFPSGERLATEGRRVRGETPPIRLWFEEGIADEPK